LRTMIERHVRCTRSERGQAVLANWDVMVTKFVRVMPNDYQRVLKSVREAQGRGLSGEEAINAAFEQNVRDVSRIGGG
jgi:glutamate synthase (ferredoxin)